MADEYLVIARAWAGFSDKFPFFDKYATVLDDDLGPSIEADVFDWAKKNRPEVTKAKAARKAQIKEGIEWRKRHALGRTGGPRSQKRTTGSSTRLTCDDSSAEGLMSMLGWGHLLNLSLARPMLMATTEEKTARHIAEVLPTRIERLDWGLLNIRLTVIPIAQVDRAKLANLEADRQDTREGRNESDNTKIHRPLLEEVDRILELCNEPSKPFCGEPESSVEEQTATTIGTDPTNNTQETKRLVSAQKALALQLREIEARWLDSNRDPTQLGFMGLSVKAAELAATLGFACPPVEYVTVWRSAGHKLFDENPSWAYLCLVRVNDPEGGLTHVEVLLMAAEARAEGAPDDDPIQLSATDAQLSCIELYLKSWKRLIEGMDLAGVEYSFSHYGARKDSIEIHAYRKQLGRELRGQGNETRAEDAERALRGEKQRKAGEVENYQALIQKNAEAYRVVAQYKNTRSTTAVTNGDKPDASAKLPGRDAADKVSVEAAPEDQPCGELTTSRGEEGLTIDTGSRIGWWNGTKLSINSHAHFEVLCTLNEAMGTIVLFQKLQSAINASVLNQYVKPLEAPPAVKEAITAIRGSFKKAGCTLKIKNVRRIGYRLHSPDT